MTEIDVRKPRASLMRDKDSDCARLTHRPGQTRRLTSPPRIFIRRGVHAIACSLRLWMAIFVGVFSKPCQALRVWWLCYSLDMYAARADAARRVAMRAERKIARYARLYERALRRARRRT